MLMEKAYATTFLFSLFHLTLAIFSGNPASEENAGYHVAVVTEYSNKKSLLCSGAIINEIWILTAAHCSRVAEDFNNGKVKVEKISVIAGENFLSRKSSYSGNAEISSNNPVLKPITQSNTKNAQKRNAVKFIVPKDFRKNCKSFDIGVILLDKKLDLKHVKVAELADPRFQTVKEKNKCIISGWGETEHAQPSEKLQEGNVEIVEPKACSKYLGFNVTSNRICAGSLKAKSVQGCRGDSGSPLMCDDDEKKLLFGIQSFVVKECGDGPALYTNVGKYKQWIDCAIKENIQDLTSDKVADYCDIYVPNDERIIESECKYYNTKILLYVLLAIALTVVFVLGFLLIFKQRRLKKTLKTDGSTNVKGQYLRRNKNKQDDLDDYDENIADHRPDIITGLNNQIKPGWPVEGSEQDVYLVL